MLLFKNILFGVILVLGFHCRKVSVSAVTQLTEPEYTSDGQCYGAGLTLNGTCPASTTIALKTITVGMRPTSHGCNATNQVAGDGLGCCDTASDSCEFKFNSTAGLYYGLCNGRQICNPNAERLDIAYASGACNSSVYPTFSEYMVFKYFCVLDSRSGPMSGTQLSVLDEALYLQSPGFPGSDIPSAVTDLSCSVETDNCGAAITVYVIERNLADYINSTLCYQNQTLSIMDPDNNVLVQWSCGDNTDTIALTLQSTDTYVTVNLTNAMVTDGGQFWIGFRATATANLTIDCPAKERQHCQPTTTTSTTTTTTTATTTTTTTPTTTSTSTSSTTAPTPTTITDPMTTTTDATTTTAPRNKTMALASPSSDSSESNTTMIIIIAVSCVFGPVLIGVIACVVYRLKRERRKGTVGPSNADTVTDSENGENTNTRSTDNESGERHFSRGVPVVPTTTDQTNNEHEPEQPNKFRAGVVRPNEDNAVHDSKEAAPDAMSRAKSNNSKISMDCSAMGHTPGDNQPGRLPPIGTQLPVVSRDTAGHTVQPESSHNERKPKRKKKKKHKRASDEEVNEKDETTGFAANESGMETNPQESKKTHKKKKKHKKVRDENSGDGENANLEKGGLAQDSPMQVNNQPFEEAPTEDDSQQRRRKHKKKHKRKDKENQVGVNEPEANVLETNAVQLSASENATETEAQLNASEGRAGIDLYLTVDKPEHFVENKA